MSRLRIREEHLKYLNLESMGKNKIIHRKQAKWEKILDSYIKAMAVSSAIYRLFCAYWKCTVTKRKPPHWMTHTFHFPVLSLINHPCLNSLLSTSPKSPLLLHFLSFFYWNPHLCCPFFHFSFQMAFKF